MSIVIAVIELDYSKPDFFPKSTTDAAQNIQFCIYDDDNQYEITCCIDTMSESTESSDQGADLETG